MLATLKLLIKLIKENHMLEQLLVFTSFTGCSTMQFLIPLPFPNTVNEATLGTLLLTDLQCVTYWTPCHANDHQALPTQPLHREAEHFPRDGTYPKHVPFPRYLLYLHPKGIT